MQKIFLILFLSASGCYSQAHPDSTANTRFYLSLNGFYFNDDIYNYNVANTPVGRTNNAYTSASFGARIYRAVYGGVKLQYNYFRTSGYYSTAVEHKYGFTGGPFIGLAIIKPNRLYYYNFRVQTLLSNVTFSQTAYSDREVMTGQSKIYYGVEVEIGLKLFPKLYVMAGISLNDQFTKDRQFNFPYAGIVIPNLFPKKENPENARRSKTIFNYKRKNPPSF